MDIKAEAADISGAMKELLRGGQIVEIRALLVPCNDGLHRTYSGYFDNVHDLASAAEVLSNRGAKGVYFTPNPVKNSPKIAKMNDIRVATRGSLTTDDDIEEIRWLLIDVDPERPTGKSATEEEKDEAKAVTLDIYTALKDLGWPQPFLGDSGNGFHLMYAVSGVDSATIREVLDGLAFMFNTDGAKVDQLVFNPSRIWKMYGTTARKGEHTPERPHRKSFLLSTPGEVVPVSTQQLQGLLDFVPKKEAHSGDAVTAQASLTLWLKEHFPSLGNPESWNGQGQRWVFDVCPWDEAHRDRSAFVVQFNNGAIAAGCLHTNCPGHEKDKNGKSLGWKKLQEMAGVQFVSGSSGQPVPISASTVDSPNLTDLGNAKRLVQMCQNELLYCPNHGTWYIYDDSHWRRDLDGGVFRRAKAAVGTIFDEAANETDPNRQTELRRHTLRSESARAINALVQLASTEIDVSIPSYRLDEDLWLFNVANGTLNLKTGKLQDHDRTDYITKVSTVKYDPEATCPMWDEFVSYAMEEDQEVVDFIHRFFGYCLTGLSTEQVLLFMEGTGCNGKTTALLMLMHVLGDYAIQGAPGLLLAKKNESHPTEVADLEGTRFVANSEVEKGKPFAESLIKQLTGSDQIRARRMRQDFYEFAPTHKLCIAANHRPIIKGNDEGIWRRVIRIPWNRQIPDDKKDPFFLDKLKLEAPGILNRILEGCRAWQENGLQPPEKVTLATDEYREEMDVLAEFMEERCILGAGQRVPQKEFYLSYVEWCEELQQKPQNYRLFNRQLKERNFKTKSLRVNGRVLRVWEGVSLHSVNNRMTGFMQLKMVDA